MPRGHLSKHPTALEIAGSSISISPVLQQEDEDNNPSYNTRGRNSAYTSLYTPTRTPPFDDDETPSFSTNLAPLYRGAGRRRSSSMSMLETPSSSAFPPYRAVSNSTDRGNSKMEFPFQAPTVATATSSSSIAATPARNRPPTFNMGNPPSHNEHFLEKRRAEAAAHYLRPDDQNMDAIYKRRLQVEYAVGRAKERIGQLGLKCPSKKHHAILGIVG